ncbi:hypothetical protein D3C72_2216090 [compost metagenome]
MLKVNDLDAVTSYGGQRIHHFSLETVVVQDMIKNANTANVGLFLGLNSEGKVTTVFIGLDKDNNIRTNSSTRKGGEVTATADDVYDFTAPCPPTCDPK